jgi:glycine dehydrogenase
MLSIKEEINEVANGLVDKNDNVLKHAPHTQHVVLHENWNRSYAKEKAVFPLPFVRHNKFWPSVGRVNNSHGDRNLICTCPPIELYEEQPITA